MIHLTCQYLGKPGYLGEDVHKVLQIYTSIDTLYIQDVAE